MTEIENLGKLLKEALEEIKKLNALVDELRKENAELKSRLGMDSTNSSLSPSSDKFTKKKDKTKSLRQKSDKPSGGQIGHIGSTLEKVDKPDFVIDIPNSTCTHCESSLENVASDEVKARQVFDIPKIKINVTEYRVQSKTCPHCAKKTVSQFPQNVTHQAQYGENVKALITNLNVYQVLPYKRIKELLSQIFNLDLSEGTISNTLKKAYKSLELVEEKIKQAIIKSDVAHADETGTKMNGITMWAHSASTSKATHIHPHFNRGKKAILDAGILAHYGGILTRDCYYSYDTFNNFTSALCCAHFLRELNYIEESTTLKFPKIVKNILLEMKGMLESGKEISEELHDKYYLKYILIIEEALLEELLLNPFHLTQTDGAGRKRRSKAYNLLKRLERHDDVLRFFLERNAELFTNNAAERDIRNFKVKNKISGCFRSEEGLKYYCRIRGYISTIMKNGMGIYDSLISIFSLEEIKLPVMS